MNKELETRSGMPVEVRSAADGTVTVEGYASVFNQPTDIGGMFTEVVAPGAFRSAILRGDDVEFLINHDGLPLARSTAGNLTMEEDAHGLKIRAQLDPQDPDVQRILPKMKRGMLDQMSFAMKVDRQEWDDSGELPKRTVMDVRLFDVSIVNRGAYPTTEIALRSRDEAQEADRKAREIEARKEKQGAIARRVRMKAATDKFIHKF